MLERFFTPHAVDRRPKTLTVHHDGGHASHLLAPIVAATSWAHRRICAQTSAAGAVHPVTLETWQEPVTTTAGGG